MSKEIRKAVAYLRTGCKLSTIGRTSFLRTIVASKWNIHAKSFPPKRAPVIIRKMVLQEPTGTA
jgi:hypothetical protein